MVPYLQGFHYYWLTNFSDLSSNFFFQFSSIIFSDIFQYFGYNSLTLPVLAKLPDFSLTGKCSPVFPGFPVLVGTRLVQLASVSTLTWRSTVSTVSIAMIFMYLIQHTVFSQSFGDRLFQCILPIYQLFITIVMQSSKIVTKFLIIN